MKKISLILTTFLFSLLGYSQPITWGKHTNTHDLPSLIYDNPLFGPEIVGAYRIYPDAVTSNFGNTNSIFDPNTVFSIYSNSETPTGNYNWTSVNDRGAWLIGKDQYGNVEISKRIKIPNKTLTVWSLQYNHDFENEVLVFTGSVSSDGDMIHKMVVGTYNLNTNVTDYKVIKENYTCQGENLRVASRGVGVRELYPPFSNKFMAIGQSGDKTNGYNPSWPCDAPSNIGYGSLPIAVIFDVSSTGTITVEHVELKDLYFKPHTISGAIASVSTGSLTSIVVGGLKLLDLTQTHLSPNGTATGIAPAVYTFEAVPTGGSTWQVSVDDGIFTTADEYAHFGLISDPEIHVGIDDNYPVDRSVYLGFTNSVGVLGNPLSPSGELTFAKFSVDLSNGVYSFVMNKRHQLFGPSGINQINGSVQRIIPREGGDHFSVVLSLFDVDDAWQRPNDISIGYVDISKNNLTQRFGGYSSIYADDVTGVGPEGLETVIRHSTGLQLEESNGDYFTYLLADGDAMLTRSARAHFYGKSTSASFSCTDYGKVQYLSPNWMPSIEGSYQEKSSSITTETIASTVQEVSGTTWECSNYFLEQAQFRKKSLFEEKEPTDPVIAKRAENSYQISNLDQNVTNYQFYNVSGQQVSIRIENNSFSMEGLAPGVYILKYGVVSKNFTEKLLVK